MNWRGSLEMAGTNKGISVWELGLAYHVVLFRVTYALTISSSSPELKLVDVQ